MVRDRLRNRAGGHVSAKVSVLTPTITGREWFLERCVASVRANGYFHEQIIVNGDGNTPNEAFARCLNMADGDYVTPVSDDDWIAPHALEYLAGLLDNGAEFAFGQTLIVNPTGNTRLRNMGGATMWRKELTDRIGGFDTQWKYAGDTDLYGRIMMAARKIAFVEEPLYFQTEHSEHSGYVNRDALAVELEQLTALNPEAISRVMQITGAVQQ